MTLDLSSYKKLYLKTANAYIADMGKNIAVLRNNRQETGAITKSHLDAHSLKSQSLMMGYQQTAILSELLEKFFYQCKMQKEELSQELVHTIAQSIKLLEANMMSIEKNNIEEDMSAGIASFEKVTKMKATQ